MNPTTLEVKTGIGLHKKFAHQLRSMKMQGHQLEWSHDGGWLTREFTVHGPIESLRIIFDAINRFQAATA